MDYERFKEGFQDALKAELAVRGADVELTARRVDKMNASYDAITVRPVDSSIGVNISVEKAFAAYENGTPIPEIAEHFADAVEKGFCESPQVDLESLSDYEQMKSKLSMEVVSAEKNAELLALSKRGEEFRAMNTELLGLSIDSLHSHLAWAKNIEEIDWKGQGKVTVPFPIVADISMAVAKKYGMLQTADWVPGDDVLLGSPLTLEDAESRIKEKGEELIPYEWYLTAKKDCK